jgi:uncharacterized membrane protein
MDARVKAIVAHFTIIGWIIALVINSSNKEEFTTFYLRQMLGIHLLFMVVSWVPVIGWFLGIVIFAFWLLSLIYTIQGEMKIIPFGEYFQDWFKAL